MTEQEMEEMSELHMVPYEMRAMVNKIMNKHIEEQVHQQMSAFRDGAHEKVDAHLPDQSDYI